MNHNILVFFTLLLAPLAGYGSPQTERTAAIRMLLVDPQATAETVALFYNLKRSAKRQILIGQQNPDVTFLGAAGESDIKKVNGNITKEGITADLEAMQRIGLGGAQIFNVSDVPEGPVQFMSPQWLELMKHAASEAGRLGRDLGFHNCAGWTSSGGPWITPEHAMQTVVTSEVRIRGPARFEAALPQPRSEQGYYRDISVLAFPTPRDDASRTEAFKSKAGFGGSDYLQPKPATIPADTCVPRDRIVDLTGKLSAGGKLSWDAPNGDWTILRIGHTMINADNHPSPRAGHGLECDKLSREALDAHWTGGIAPILAKAGPLVGKTLNNILIDSYETGNGNWTPRLREEFQRRRGYDLTQFLPALSGRTVDSSEVTERFLWDFRRTLSDLFGENYYK